MSYMFKGCSSLEEVNLSNFNTENVTNMECMFSRCKSLEKLDLSNFNTNKVNYMIGMLYGCSDQFQRKIKARYKNIKEVAFH